MALTRTEVNIRYRINHLEEYRAYNRRYYQKNRERILDYHAQFYPGYRLRKKALSRIRYLRMKEDLSQAEFRELTKLIQDNPPRRIRRVPWTAIVRDVTTRSELRKRLSLEVGGTN